MEESCWSNFSLNSYNNHNLITSDRNGGLGGTVQSTMIVKLDLSSFSNHNTWNTWKSASDGQKVALFAPFSSPTMNTRLRVVVFGWLNCKPKHLQKVSSWWKEKKIEPTLVFSPPQTLFLPYWCGRPAGSKLCAELEANNGQNRDLFLHAFSGQVWHHTNLCRTRDQTHIFVA